MLQPINRLNLSDAERFTIALRGWIALDPDSGAFLSQTSGRGKGGLPTFILILPNRPVSERGGLLAPYEWDYPTGRKRLRAWTEAEAIEAANRKLARMLAIRADQPGPAMPADVPTDRAPGY